MCLCISSKKKKNKINKYKIKLIITLTPKTIIPRSGRGARRVEFARCIITERPFGVRSTTLYWLLNVYFTAYVFKFLRRTVKFPDAHDGGIKNCRGTRNIIMAVYLPPPHSTRQRSWGAYSVYFRVRRVFFSHSERSEEDVGSSTKCNFFFFISGLSTRWVLGKVLGFSRMAYVFGGESRSGGILFGETNFIKIYEE